MQFAIMRRNGWSTAESLGEAAKRSTHARDVEMKGRLEWIRSYVFQEEDGTLATICIYEADRLEDVREHARRADLPAQEILPITKLLVNRPDPVLTAG